MAGKCALCNNLEGLKFIIDDKMVEASHCVKAKFDKDGVCGYHSIEAILKPSKSVKEIEDNCDSWDDRLKPKKIN